MITYDGEDPEVRMALDQIKTTVSDAKIILIPLQGLK